MACSPGSGSTWRLSAACREPDGALPTNSSFDFLCRIASRVRSPMASRSHWLTETMMFRTSLPEALPVSRDSATDTNETPRRWNCSNKTARSLTDRVSRSNLATITMPTARDCTISRIRTIPGRSRSFADSPASTKTSRSSTSWTVAIARIFSTCASRETPWSACLSVETRTYPIPFVFIAQISFQHAEYGGHKLSGYPLRPRGESAKTPGREFATPAPHQHTEGAATPATGFCKAPQQKRIKGRGPETRCGRCQPVGVPAVCRGSHHPFGEFAKLETVGHNPRTAFTKTDLASGLDQQTPGRKPTCRS